MGPAIAYGARLRISVPSIALTLQLHFSAPSIAYGARLRISVPSIALTLQRPFYSLWGSLTL
jgi:hypothetical protein